MSLPEALYIVSQNAHGIPHNYWDVYLPAILLVNEAFPHEGTTSEGGADEWVTVGQSYGAMIERDNYAVYSNKEQY